MIMKQLDDMHVALLLIYDRYIIIINDRYSYVIV